MKAIVYKHYGDPSVLRWEERPAPKPLDNELLISVRAVEATKSDCEMRSFRFPVSWFAVPLRLAFGIFAPRRQILGSYFSGVVQDVGAKVSRFSPGDSVFGCSRLRLGAYAELFCLPEDYTLAPLPRGLTFEEAAAVPLGGLNALHFMRLAKIEAGERVLIVGAGGSIGCYALQIAKSMGAHVTVVDAAHKREGLLSFGADRFIDYATSHFWDQDDKYDVVFNVVASLPFSRALSVLEPQGRYLTGNPKLSDMLQAGWTNLVSERRAYVTLAGETQEELSTLREMLESGEIRSSIDRTLALKDARRAHELVESEERVGSIVLRTNEQTSPQPGG